MLALPEASPELVADVDLAADAIGSCPACPGGALRSARMHGETIAICSLCSARWVGATQIARMKSRTARQTAHIEPMTLYAERFEKAQQLAFDTPAANTYALPIFLGIGLFAHAFGFGVLVWFTVEMWFHELGHAIVAWLGGFMAVPLPFFTIVPRDDRSVTVIATVLAMIGAIAFEAVRRKLWVLVGFAGALAVIQGLLTFVLNPAQSAQWWIFAGQGGAIVLPTLVMLAFYQPIGWRWDFWRYPAAALAAVGYVHAMFIWVGVARGTAVMPHGSAVGEESEGDMERLVRTYGWTRESLAHAYLALGFACLAALAIAYAIYWRRARLDVD
ncbi:MAG: hypothetical protein M3O46_03215 [Myxococcota bacterium]|nr:hypothetical protein [Myxococcota bacterium]